MNLQTGVYSGGTIRNQEQSINTRDRNTTIIFGSLSTSPISKIINIPVGNVLMVSAYELGNAYADSMIIDQPPIDVAPIDEPTIIDSIADLISLDCTNQTLDLTGKKGLELIWTTIRYFVKELLCIGSNIIKKVFSIILTVKNSVEEIFNYVLAEIKKLAKLAWQMAKKVLELLGVYRIGRFIKKLFNKILDFLGINKAIKFVKCVVMKLLEHYGIDVCLLDEVFPDYKTKSFEVTVDKVIIGQVCNTRQGNNCLPCDVGSQPTRYANIKYRDSLNGFKLSADRNIMLITIPGDFVFKLSSENACGNVYVEAVLMDCSACLPKSLIWGN